MGAQPGKPGPTQGWTLPKRANTKFCSSMSGVWAFSCKGLTWMTPLPASLSTNTHLSFRLILLSVCSYEEERGVPVTIGRKGLGVRAKRRDRVFKYKN